MPEIVKTGGNPNWFKGMPAANPNGSRPNPVNWSISECLRRALAGGNAQEIANEIIRIALYAKTESTRVQAAAWISDRTEGRPMQSMEVRQTVDESTMRVMNALYAHAFPEELKTIDGELVESNR